MNLELTTIFLFLRQGGLALAGAAALWGIYFWWQRKKEKENSKREKILEEISIKMIKPLGLGVVFAALGWIGLEFSAVYKVLAHEGISFDYQQKNIVLALDVLRPFMVSLLAIFLTGVSFKKIYPEKFSNQISLFYGSHLTITSILISFPVWFNSFNLEQIFFIGHNFHSILTLGTVLILDFLFVLTKYSEEMELYVYPLLDTVSKVIWVGLAIEFLSVGLVFQEVIVHSSKFLFMQTVIAVLIMNGIFLAGPVLEKIKQSSTKGSNEKVDPVNESWERAATFSGSVSAASWITITFVDLISDLALSYTTLMVMYVTFVVFVFIIYEVLEHYKVGRRW